MSHEIAKPFALFGAEKMLYDSRMHPQAICDGERIVIAYQAGADGVPGHPHVIAYDRAAGRWSEPVRIGTAAGIDHHFAPVIWFDRDGALHALYNCHFTPGMHLVCRRPDRLDTWGPGEPIAESITYPSVWHVAGGRRLMVYRVEGHLGYWVYRTSDDGNDWSPERTILDFDLDPTNEIDRWAGSYVGLCPSRDGRRLHLGLTWWDERSGAHPVYRFKRDLLTRYHLYYLSLDIDVGTLSTIDGRSLGAPLKRSAAEACKVLDTGHELTNFPTVATSPNDEPYLLVPVSEGSPWTCRFEFFRRDGGRWRRTTITRTDNTWSGSRLIIRDDGEIQAHLIVGRGKGEETFYGGGTLQEWVSRDVGETWELRRQYVPEPGLFYNNPRPVETLTGEPLADAFVFYGWQGPGGVWPTEDCDTETRNRGRAYLWLNGRWV